jgi:hypothetical protein
MSDGGGTKNIKIPSTQTIQTLLYNYSLLSRELGKLNYRMSGLFFLRKSIIRNSG